MDENDTSQRNYEHEEDFAGEDNLDVKKMKVDFEESK